MSELEIDIETRVILAASAAGHRLFKNKVGVRRTPGSYVKLGIGGDGAPDLWGWTKDGYAVLIEMKKPGKKPTKEQNDWRAGALVSCPTLRIGWADSVEKAMAILEQT